MLSQQQASQATPSITSHMHRCSHGDGCIILRVAAEICMVIVSW